MAEPPATPQEFRDIWINGSLDADDLPPFTPTQPPAVDADLSFLSLLPHVLKPTGWLDNIRANAAISRRQQLAGNLGLNYLGPARGEFVQPRQTAKNLDLKAYIRELKGNSKPNEVGPLERGANIGDAQPADGTGPVPAGDPLDQRTPATGPGRAARLRGRNTVSASAAQTLKLRRCLLQARHLIDEGIWNAKNNDRTTHFSIKEDELVKGYETEFDPSRPEQPLFRLKPHQREAVGRWEYLMKKRKAVLLADDMGLGKTPTAIAVMQRGINAAIESGGPEPFYMVCVPASTILNWITEFAKAPHIKVCDMSRVKHLSASQIQRQYHVALVSHQKLGLEYGRLLKHYRHYQAVKEGLDEKVQELLSRKKKPEWLGSEPRTTSVLFSLECDQLITDEVHNARNPTTSLARALRAVKARGRVAMTGAPLQNGLADFGALLLYLNIQPFCIPGLFRACFTSKRDTGNLTQSTKFHNRMNDAALGSIRSALGPLRGKYGIFNEKRIIEIDVWDEELLDHDLGTQEAQFQEKTRDIWDREHVRKQREEFPHESAIKWPPRKTLSEALVDIGRARLHVIHPELINARYGDENFQDPEHVVQVRDLFTDEDRPASAPQQASTQVQAELNAAAREKLNKRRKVYLQPFYDDPYRAQSDRIFLVTIMLVELFYQRLREAARLPTPLQRLMYLSKHRVLIFSDFLSVLDLQTIDLSNEAPEIKFLRFDGSMSKTERAENKAKFEDSNIDWSRYTDETPEEDLPKTDVFAMFLTNKAGFEGHTFIHATEVFIINPTWNPAVEDEIAGRSARMGQENKVTVYRFHAENSIERRVRLCQSEKRQENSYVVDDSFLIKQSKLLQVNDEDRLLKRLGFDRALKALARGDFQL